MTSDPITATDCLARRPVDERDRRGSLPSRVLTPLVAVLDGHPQTLFFLAGVRGDRIRCLGVREFGQSSSLADAYALHGMDCPAIVDAALSLLGQ